MTGELQRLLDRGDAQMRAGDPAAAVADYHAAWLASRVGVEPSERVWILLSIANAAVRAGDFEDAFAACKGALDQFAQTKVVVGNPLFHLLVGLAYSGLGEGTKVTDDAFARAMICGGPAMFTDEDPRHLARMLEILKPPSELGTWTGYTGCSRDLMNGATGYLAELLAHRLGSPPPYRYDD